VGFQMARRFGPWPISSWVSSPGGNAVESARPKADDSRSEAKGRKPTMIQIIKL
jgi:hypothetical protein